MVKNIPYHTSEGKTRIAAEYIWMDGTKPTVQPRSKTKILTIPEGMTLEELDIPIWGFDGSSTHQAKTKPSDCILNPVRVFYDPFMNTGEENFPHLLVLNEVLSLNREAHETNTRIRLREKVEEFKEQEYWFGIEQEYTFLTANKKPLGFPAEGFPEKQGKYYCGVGAEKVFGRSIKDAHLKACLKAGILYDGANGEVLPGQWEYQIGPGDPLLVADNLILGRYLAERIGEMYNVRVSLTAKPVKGGEEEGEWNGAGAHTNFSTKAMRQGTIALEEIASRLGPKHSEHIAIYGQGIEERLTGDCETANIKTFKYGPSDRGASVRIPWQVVETGKGYLEDRRPNANMDPYLVLAKIMETVGRT